MSRFRLALSRATDDGRRSIAEHNNALHQWSARPWWRRILTGRPTKGPTEIAYEATGDEFDDLTSARMQAELLSNSLQPTDDQLCVVILNDDGDEVGGFWPAGGGPI